MSAAWQPRGPEPARTYWIRRGAVLVALVLVLALIVWGVTAMASGSKQPTAVPAGPASDTASPGQTASVELSASGSAATPHASASAAPSSSPSARHSASSTPAPASASPKPSADASPKKDGPLGCDPATVRLSVKGTSPVKSGSTTRLTVAASSKDGGCLIDLDKNPLELRIYSGKDRIWSSRDCAKWGPTGAMKVPDKGAWTWQASWSTQRSSADCTLSDEYLKPGTYVATAVISGGAPAQYVMKLVG